MLRHLRESNNDKRNGETYVPECDKCYFRMFMVFFGILLNKNNCCMNCTKQSKEKSDKIFKVLVDNLVFEHVTETLCYIKQKDDNEK